MFPLTHAPGPSPILHPWILVIQMFPLQGLEFSQLGRALDQARLEVAWRGDQPIHDTRSHPTILSYTKAPYTTYS